MRMAEDARRQDLLEKGRRLFAATHADSRSMAALAKEAGCSKALLYHHFGNRRGYYLAVLADIAKEFTVAIEPDPALPFEEALRGALGRFLALAESQPSTFRLFVHGGVGVDVEAEALVQGVRDAALLFLRHRLNAGDGPRFRLAAAAWVRAVETMAEAWLEGAESLSPEVVIELLETSLDAVRVAIRMDRPQERVAS